MGATTARYSGFLDLVLQYNKHLGLKIRDYTPYCYFLRCHRLRREFKGVVGRVIKLALGINSETKKGCTIPECAEIALLKET